MKYKTEGLAAGTILAVLGIVLLVIDCIHPAGHLVRDGLGFLTVGLLIDFLCAVIDHHIQNLS